MLPRDTADLRDLLVEAEQFPSSSVCHASDLEPGRALWPAGASHEAPLHAAGNFEENEGKHCPEDPFEEEAGEAL